MALALFGISALLSALSSATVATLYVWPWLRRLNRERALAVLVAPHLFLRFIGLSFLVPGVAGPSLPAAFAVPAAYGDLVAGVLAIIATFALAALASWANVAVWVFNVWGAADLLYALVEGVHFINDPGDLGATFFIPTAIVPPLLMTHALIFLILIRAERSN
jgi:hypothetical protein